MPGPAGSSSGIALRVNRDSLLYFAQKHVKLQTLVKITAAIYVCTISMPLKYIILSIRK